MTTGVGNGLAIWVKGLGGWVRGRRDWAAVFRWLGAWVTQAIEYGKPLRLTASVRRRVVVEGCKQVPRCQSAECAVGKCAGHAV